jgi:hypothetical protein
MSFRSSIFAFISTSIIETPFLCCSILILELESFKVLDEIGKAHLI